MALISLLICSRISGNKNWALPDFLESLKDKSSNYENFEVLIKFDSDDKKVRKTLPTLSTYPFKIKYLIEPRGRGYLDLYLFYNRLLPLSDENSFVVAAMADDFDILKEGWDEIILNQTRVFPDQIFIIRTGSTILSSVKNKDEQRFYLDFDINSLENLCIVDEAPFWSRKLLEICGGVGHVGASTDTWTITLEYYLFHRCGLNRTIFLEESLIYRKTRDDIDQQSAPRWWTDRATMFAFARSPFFNTLVEQQAINIYCNIKIAEMSALPPPFVPDKSDFKPTILTPSDLQRLKRELDHRKMEDAVWQPITRVMDKIASVGSKVVPAFMRPSLNRIYLALHNGLNPIRRQNQRKLW